jgi:Leucine-rich repeat (LRR) protein
MGHISGITGTIPSEVWTLSNLEDISISAGSLSTSPFPPGPTLSGLTKLTVLELRTADLTGAIPTEIGLLTDLQVFRLSFNAITGTIPTELGLLTQLSDIQVTHEDISGPIPTEIGMLTQMEKLSAYSNSLTGTVPSEMGRLSLLTHINFSLNDLTGKIPTEMCLLGELLSFFHDPCENSYLGTSCLEEACREEDGAPDGGGSTRNLFSGGRRR